MSITEYYLKYHFMSSLSTKCMVQIALTLQNFSNWSRSMYALTVNSFFLDSWEVALSRSCIKFGSPQLNNA